MKTNCIQNNSPAFSARLVNIDAKAIARTFDKGVCKEVCASIPALKNIGDDSVVFSLKVVRNEEKGKDLGLVCERTFKPVFEGAEKLKHLVQRTFVKGVEGFYKKTSTDIIPFEEGSINKEGILKAAQELFTDAEDSEAAEAVSTLTRNVNNRIADTVARQQKNLEQEDAAELLQGTADLFNRLGKK